jgi:CheY-like chemotaxis protein
VTVCATCEPEGPSCAAGSILIVDDSITIRDVLRRTLELGSFEVVEAVDGMEALAILRRRTDFKLLIVDLMMPRMDGDALIHRLRTSHEFPSFRILVLTGEEVDPQAAPVSGVDAWMRKPFTPSILLRKVRDLLR